MSDDQNTVPPAPVPAASPGGDAAPVTPEPDPAAPEDEGADKEKEEGSEGAADPAQDEEEAPASDPVVETTPSGQTVTFPDGRVVHTRSSDAPVSNGEWQQYERTHQGDQLRYAFVPGDKAYSPYSDPSVPDSRTAQQIEREIASYGERVQQNPETEISYLWNGLRGMHEGELDRAIATGGGSDKVMA